jgi:hypothetical protein
VPKIDDEVCYGWVDLAKVKQESQDKGAMCDWDPVKASLFAIEEERFLLVFDEDEELGDNYFACTTAHAAKWLAGVNAILDSRKAAAPSGGGGDGGGGGETRNPAISLFAPARPIWPLTHTLPFVSCR